MGKAEKLVKTVCGMCGVGCGLDITVENGRAIKVQGMKEHVISKPCRRGVDGEMVFVETTAGRARLKAVLTEDIREDVVQVTHGWPGDGNANLLIDSMNRDEISGFPAFKSQRCRILKAG